MKRLTWKEMQKQRAQGICFNCDDKFTLDHKCRGPRLFWLEGSYSLNDEAEINEETIIEPEISLHALTGWSTSSTMRVRSDPMRWLSSLIVVPPIILLVRRLLICYNYWWFQPGHST